MLIKAFCANDSNIHFVYTYMRIVLCACMLFSEQWSKCSKNCTCGALLWQQWPGTTWFWWSISLSPLFLHHWLLFQIFNLFRFSAFFKLELFSCMFYVAQLNACSTVYNVIQCLLHCAFLATCHSKSSSGWRRCADKDVPQEAKTKTVFPV